MTPENHSQLVEVFVPTQAGEGNIATGFPVSKNRILTARHTLFVDGELASTIEVRWYNETSERRIWRKINRVAWEGGEKFDAALLDCGFPDGAVGYVPVSTASPADSMRWTSAGFAEAGARDDGARKPVRMKGDVFSAAERDDVFELGVQYPVGRPDGWRGASGSPVFVLGEILGVIKSCPANFNAARLEPTPIWKLLQIPELSYGRNWVMAL